MARNTTIKTLFTLERKRAGHPVNTVAVFMEFIESKVEIDDQINHQRRADTDWQADNIYQRKELVFPKATKCNFKIVFYHCVGH